MGETGLSDDEWMQTQLHQFSSLAATGRYPAFSRALTELTGGFDLDFDALFELGLQSLLDGFATVAANRKRKGAILATT